MEENKLANTTNNAIVVKKHKGMPPEHMAAMRQKQKELNLYRKKGSKNKVTLIKEAAIKEAVLKNFIPPKFAFKKHRELLAKKETARIYNYETGQFERVVMDQPDPVAVGKALDMYYKAMGLYAPIGVKHELDFILPDGQKIMELE